MPSLQNWKTLSSKYLIQTPWLTVRSDKCETPDGDIIDPFFVIEHPDWVNTLAIDDNNNVIILRQYRHGVGKYVLDLPSGAIEPKDASPEAGARRELLEEAGWDGGEFYYIGSTYPNSASHTNTTYSFLAVGGSCSLPQELEKGENLRVEKIPFGDFMRDIHEVHTDPEYQALHLTAIYFAENFIRNSQDPKLQALQKYLP